MNIKLPTPIYKGKVSLEETIYKRISRRRFISRKLTKEQLSQLLWTTQGLTQPLPGHPGRVPRSMGRAGLTSAHSRAVPSAGATYPLEVFVVVGEDCVEGIPGGIYWYRYNDHTIDLHKQGDWRSELGRACWGQDFISNAPIDIAITAEFERTTTRYGRRGYQYAYMEVGHAGQNIYLEAEALGLGTVAIGAFSDEDVKKVLDLPKELVPLYIMPVGYAK